MRDNIFETLVGTAVLLLAGGFLIFALNATGASFDGRVYRIEAAFTSVGGLAVGSDVKIKGIKVGSVTELRVGDPPYYPIAELAIDRSIELSDDTFAKIAIDSLLGPPYVDLMPGGSDEMLTDGASISRFQTQGSIDLIGLISRAMFSSGGGDDGEE